MSKKGRWISWSMGGIVILIVTFVLVMTWLFPFSPFSVNRNYNYQHKKILFNDKNYEEILNEFKDDFEELNEDSAKKYPNLTEQTQYVLPIFEEEWLLSEDSVPINKVKLGTMLLEVQQVREAFLNLIAQEDYTSEDRGYIINIIRNLLSLEDSIRELQTENYMTRNELKRGLDNLYVEYTGNFRFFVSSYDRLISE